MKIGRRGFLQRMAAAPMLGKAAADEAVKVLASAGIGATGGSPYPTQDLRDMVRETAPEKGGCNTAIPTGPRLPWDVLRKMRDDLVLKALDTPQSRAEIEAILYEQNRLVHSIDPDLAFNRSMSPAAKIVFQRQRNVRRQIEWSLLETTTHSRVRDWKHRILSLAGLDTEF